MALISLFFYFFFFYVFITNGLFSLLCYQELSWSLSQVLANGLTFAHSKLCPGMPWDSQTGQGHGKDGAAPKHMNK